VAGFTALLGETRSTIGFGPLLYWASALSLVAFIGGRWFDRAAGLVAAALLTLTPDFTAAALKPSADTSELAFQLAAVAAATWAFGAQSRAWALSGGILAGLALQSRDTSLLFIGAAALAWLFLDRQRRKVLLWAVPGLVVAVGAEMLVYWASSGDPLYRFRLALGHVTIPSAELAAHVDTSRSPLFNPEYIAGWRRPAGIQLFWPIDPWLNLLASPRIGVLLIGTMAAAALFARRLDRSWRRPLVLLNACALLVAVLLVYGLAVDPKPRMFACLYAACALTAGALLTAAFRSESRIPGTALFGLIAALDLMMLYRYPTTYHAEQEARRWLAAYPGDIEIDGQTRAYLTLVAEARALPASGSGKPLRITAARRRCDDIATSDAAKGAMLLASTRSRVPGQQGQLCLFRYAAAASAH
jgi:4-amino-4-deoxy-L-arabinose transferase-like glycosyltransferase